MGYCKIPKGGGRFRWVYAPTRSQKRKCRFYLPRLHSLQESVCDGDVVHGFWRGRSAVTNAVSHTGRSYTVSMDLEDFFPSVTRKMVFAVQDARLYRDDPELFILRVEEEGWLKGSFSKCEEAIAEQGLPTSPMFANIAFSPVDALLKKELVGCTYTRYADDLTISWDDDPSLKDQIISTVAGIVQSKGFKVNASKTRFQNGKFGRRIITGVGVSWSGVHYTREMRRKHRAARHNGWHLKQRGYEEWMKLKIPSQDGWIKLLIHHVTKLAKQGKTRDEIISLLEHSWKTRSTHKDWIAAVDQAIFYARAVT